MLPLANFLSSLWNWISPPPEEDGASEPVSSRSAGAGASKATGGTAKPAGKYAAVRQAVELRLEELVRSEIPEHREIAKRDVLELHYIEIESSPEGEELLRSFFKDFSPSARQDWIRDRLGANRQVDLECFAGVFGSFDLPGTGHLDKHTQILNQGAAPVYRVNLYAHWVQQVPEPAAPGGRPVPGPPVVIGIRDAQGQRQERRAEYPCKVGRGGKSRVVVAGKFVSTEHFTLHYEDQRFWLEDHSRNGTWLDGTRVPRDQRIALDQDSYRLKLGKEKGEAADCPELILEIQRTPVADSAGFTPVAASNATPVISAPLANELLAVLAIKDTTGSLLLDVLGLPFTIGRNSGLGYTVPAGNAGVSGEHLVIERLTAEGAEVVNRAVAKNGTSLNGTPQPERFLWPYDAEIQLAPRWRKDPEVRIVLKRPG